MAEKLELQLMARREVTEKVIVALKKRRPEILKESADLVTELLGKITGKPRQCTAKEDRTNIKETMDICNKGLMYHVRWLIENKMTLIHQCDASVAFCMLAQSWFTATMDTLLTKETKAVERLAAGPLFERRLAEFYAGHRQLIQKKVTTIVEAFEGSLALIYPGVKTPNDLARTLALNHVECQTAELLEIARAQPADLVEAIGGADCLLAPRIEFPADHYSLPTPQPAATEAA